MKKDTIALRKVICKRFRAIRQKLGLTQKELSRQLGVPIKNLSTIEVEGQLPTISLILKLMQSYKLSPLWLLTGKGEMFLVEDTPEPTQVEYFKKAFPGVPADPELIDLIEKMAIPVLRNSLFVKFYELSETFSSHIEKFEKQKLSELSTTGQQSGQTSPGKS
jgi:transcriptional regulator with XRE-family HTH domain